MPRREERTARRAESLVGGDGARGGRDTCGIWNGLVAGWTYKYMRVGYSCRLRFRCALGLVEDSARGGTGSTRSICPNPATHSGRQHITVGLFAPLISITLNASSPEDRVIVTIWVPQAQTLFPGGATVQGVVDLARVATTRGQANANADEDKRGAFTPQQNTRMPCGVYAENLEIRVRLAFSGWAAHPRLRTEHC